jgi:hypothetical protein
MTTARTVGALCALLTSSSAYAATLGVAADTYVMRNSTTDNSSAAPLIVKNANNPPDSNNDRVTFLRFDTTGLAPVTAASLSLAIHNNAVPAGFQVQLYGIPDGASNENFDASTLTFANNGYTATSTADSTDNNVLDASLTLLGTYTFDQAIAQGTAGTSPGNMTFSDAGGALTSFLNANTNNVATFLLTTPTHNDSNTIAFWSRDNTTSQAIPTLATDADAVPVPEPASAALVAFPVLAAAVLRRSRKSRISILLKNAAAPAR